MAGTSDKRYVVEILMVGVHPGGILFCLKCRDPFQIGEAWRKITLLGRDGYSVGIHETCWADHIAANVNKAVDRIEAGASGGQDV